MKTLTVLTLVCLLGLVSRAQTFTDIASQIGLEVFVMDNIYGSGVSTADFDMDGVDDLTFCTHEGLAIYRNDNGNLQPIAMGIESDGPTKHAVWLDYDNDGDRDLFFTQYQNPPKLYRNNGIQVYEDVSLEAGFAETDPPHYGCSWGDYDRDGDLDVYLCSYVYVYNGENPYQYYNHLYKNNGNGTFTDVTAESGTSDGISLSFQSVWLDYNNDLWPDLYVINDLEHPNRLYLNNADGTFDEVSAESGTAIAEVDAMCATCGDYNRDGWTDVFVTNTSLGPPALLRNNTDGTFTDLAVSANVDQQVVGWAGNWIDYDLDSDLDLHVCEHFANFPQLPNLFYENNGDGSFVEIGSALFPFDYSDSHASAQCDWNHDGYPDLAINNYNMQNANLWQNTGGSGNYCGVGLQGIVSNKDGVGSKIELWASSGYQSAYTHCGENYLGQDSYYEHFGLGESTVLDSLRITWPSGHIDRYYSVPVQSYEVYVEGDGFNNEIGYEGDLFLCEGDSIVLDAGPFASYNWNTGATEQHITVFTTDTLWVEVMTEEGLFSTSEIVVVSQIDDVETNIDISLPTCHASDDAAFQIEASGEIIMGDNSALDILYVDSLTAGFYPFTIVDYYGCEFQDTLEIISPDPLAADFIIEDPSCFDSNDGSAMLSVTGGFEPYVVEWNGVDPENLEMGNYSVFIVDSLGCKLFQNIVLLAPDSILVELGLGGIECTENLMSIDIDVIGGTPPYSFNWTNGNTSEDLSDAVPEIVSVEVMDSLGCLGMLTDLSCPTHIEDYGSSAPAVFPIPVHDILQIDNATFINRIVIYDQLGRELIHLTVEQQFNHRIDLSALAKGNYCLITYGRTTETFHIIKQ